MRFVSFNTAGKQAIGVVYDGVIFGVTEDDPRYPGNLKALLAAGRDAMEEAARLLSKCNRFDEKEITYRPVIDDASKILCVGLNYHDHTKESGYSQPDYPAIFCRVNSSLAAHLRPIVRPRVSDSLDFEGELAAVIGRGGKHIPRSQALEHVAGYALFNDGSVRQYQHRSTQWTVGKNFDLTGAFGPQFVTSDELPTGASGLHLETRLNGKVVQSASTSDMIFDVAALISLISEAMTLEPGDVIVTGTPAGIGHAREPRLYMRPGDIVEVEIERIGVLRNPIADEEAA